MSGGCFTNVGRYSRRCPLCHSVDVRALGPEPSLCSLRQYSMDCCRLLRPQAGSHGNCGMCCDPNRQKALKNNVMWSIAAVAFIRNLFLNLPFPAIVFSAGLIGFIGGNCGRIGFNVASAHGPKWETTPFSAMRRTHPNTRDHRGRVRSGFVSRRDALVGADLARRHVASGGITRSSRKVCFSARPPW